MRKIRLRTKFLLSLLVISTGLTTATLLIVRYSVEKRIRESIREELRDSVSTYRSFERQREGTLTRSAELLANLPNVRALMTTQDPVTIQDGSADIWRLSGSELLVLAGRSGNVMGLRSSSAGLSKETAQKLMQRSLERAEPQDWWLGGGHLYEVWIQPIYFGSTSEERTLGYMAVGYEVDERAAKDFSNIASSEVAFRSGSALVTSTVAAPRRLELVRQLDSLRDAAAEPQEITLGSDRYLVSTVSLSADAIQPVSLSVLKSFDKATAFLSELNRVLLGLGLVCVLAGSFVVFVISDTFTRPLANLVAGVRALEGGDFAYPLESSGGDEVAEVTGAFDRMRANLQKTQNEHRSLEERLRQAHKMEAVGRLAGGVAHDFNNLLTIIRGHGDLLLDRADTLGPVRNSIEQMQKAAGRAVSMTRQLLAFSRMQVLQPRLLDLNAVVADMGKMLPRLIGEHIEYSFVPQPKLQAVKADPGQIEQVVMNLAVNARDAMPEGGSLTVRTQNISMTEADVRDRPPMVAGHYVMLSVKDSGHGMDGETLTRIFEPFFTTKEVGKGTGLGLATVYGVIKQSGGFIWVDSAPGKGSTFEIYLPQVLENVAAVEPDAKPSAIPRGSETILVVEDEEGVRDLACRFLKGVGYTVLEARDGVEALEIAGRHTGVIHLALSDMVMPRMGGAVLMERLKAVRPDTKLMLMTGYSDYVSSPGAAASDPIPVMEKPFSKHALVEKIQQILNPSPAESATAGARCTT